MVDTIENAPSDSPAFERKAQSRPACFHCGEPCDLGEFERNDKNFCCHGCLTVHELLIENGLGHFYDLRSHPGIRMRKSVGREKWAYLDQAEVWQKLVDFSDKKLTKVTFRIPSIHCLACVWLLENLFQLHSAIGRGTVNFLKREAAISFETGRIKFSELVGLLSSIGYEPELNLGELEQGKDQAVPARKKQWLQIGVAGFAFGNIMLFSLPLYLGLDSSSGPAFKQLIGWLSLILALPVLTYSATDYWRSAWVSLRQRVLTLDVPIALGLAAIYGQSLYEISNGIGAGYCDSLTGLIFFLLCGRFFQQTTYNRMAFDRDYKCFFPLSVVRQSAGGEETISISNLQPGDRLILRHGELIPADSKLISGEALLDYSFVSGESAPVSKTVGDYLYAGGQQIGAAIELETIKAVSQSYLTSLWNDEAFKKDREDHLNTLTNRYSRRFTRIVLGVAVGAALFWWWTGEPARGFKALVSVLIVACPCALALAAPFASGTAQRILGRIQVFLKNAFVLERMAHVTTIVFDKTGTLTSRANGLIVYPNSPTEAGLTPEEKSAVVSLVRNSTHPHASGIAESLADYDASERVRGFQEVPGRGIAGEVSGVQVVIGSSKWLDSFGICTPSLASPDGSVSYLAMGGVYRGRFILKAEFRRELKQLIECLPEKYEIALLSGDNDNDRDRFQLLFGSNSRLLFNQTPADKLAFIRTLQSEGKRVMMVGDGLNDAGALKQSDVGIAVVEKVGSFSPASDVILEAGQVSQLFKILTFARRSTLVVRVSFIISALYNLVGIGIAAAGFLSPLVCAILMPLSSVSVVLFSCGATTWMASRLGLCTTPGFPSLKKA